MLCTFTCIGKTALALYANITILFSINLHFQGLIIKHLLMFSKHFPQTITTYYQDSPRASHKAKEKQHARTSPHDYQ